MESLDVGILRITQSPFTVDWDIEKYFSKPQKVGNIFRSPHFIFEEAAWCLSLYPNGSRHDNTVGNVGIYLKMVSLHKEYKISFSIGLRNGNGTLCAILQTTHFFTECEYSFGTNKLIERSELEKYKKSILGPKNTLTVFVKDFILIHRTIKTGFVPTIIKTEEEDDVDSKEEDLTDEDEEDDIDTEQKDSEDCLSDWCNRSLRDWSNERNAGDKNLAAEVSRNEEDNSIKQKDLNKEDWRSAWSHRSQKDWGNVSDNNLAAEVPRNEEDISNTQNDLDKEGIEILIRDLKGSLLKEEGCDVIFKVKNEEIKAHRSLLTARSPVFASMFRHNMSEKNTGIVNIADCSPDAFKKLLLYLYSGTIASSSSDLTLDLYEASIKYDLENLQKKCIQFMKDDMSVLTFCDILATSLRHNELELIKCATDFFIKHIEDILPTVEWQMFLKENHIPANELLIKAIKNR